MQNPNAKARRGQRRGPQLAALARTDYQQLLHDDAMQYIQAPATHPTCTFLKEECVFQARFLDKNSFSCTSSSTISVSRTFWRPLGLRGARYIQSDFGCPPFTSTVHEKDMNMAPSIPISQSRRTA